MLCSSDSLAFFLFVLAFLTCEGQEEYICKRLVTEKYRCEIFNYRHPLCKKWDHSQCPPPRIIRDLSPCVSYSCVREGKKKEWNTVARTTPIPTTAATVVTDTKETVEGVSQNVVNKNQTSSAQSALSALSSKNQVDIQTLTNQITRLRRVISLLGFICFAAYHIFAFLFFFYSETACGGRRATTTPSGFATRASTHTRESGGHAEVWVQSKHRSPPGAVGRAARPDRRRWS